MFLGVSHSQSWILSQVTNNLISDDDDITLTCIEVDDFIDGLLLKWFFTSKEELISTIASDQLVLATTISDKVVTICCFYLLTLLAITSDCKRQIDVRGSLIKELSIVVALLTVLILPTVILPLPELPIFVVVVLFALLTILVIF